MVIRATMKNTERLFTALRSGTVMLVLVSVLICGLSSDACARQDRWLAQAKKAMEKADAYMGDWRGTWTLDDGYTSGPLVAQVIALGKDEYRANFHVEFDHEWPPMFALEGKLDDSAPQFNGRAEFGHVLDITSAIKAGKFAGKFKGTTSDGESAAGTFTMEKTVRLSPTLGAKPPEGAVVLFDGKKAGLNNWLAAPNRRNIESPQWIRKGRAMEVKPRTSGIISKQKFGDVKLHLEFRTPFMPEARGQGRGNSGVYLQGRYEVQILDSYGLEGRDNECGGIYKVGTPLVNMCAPPTQWQTYDITFRAPRFDAGGEKVEPATLKVVHNGVTIQDGVKAGGPTTAAPDRTEKGPGGIYLQDHGNPVQYRNIWLVELPATDL
ncbi:MAG: 3-keto-disaccharide hydrolase [Planctomycetota bacterium]